jgi:hypothetical protein
MTRLIIALSIIILIPLTIVSVSNAQSKPVPMKAELTASRDKVFVGEAFTLNVQVEYITESGEVDVTDPQFPDLVEFEKISSVMSSQNTNIIYNNVTKQTDISVIYEFSRQYKALQIGEYKIPPVEFEILDKAQPQGKLKMRTNGITIKVVALDDEQPLPQPGKEEEKPDIRDIKGPVKAPFWVLYAFGAGGFVLLLSIAFLVTRLVKGHPSKTAKAPVRVIASPYERAIAKLKELKMPDIVDDPAVAVFYVRLSDIVKEYLGSKHNVMGFEATTFEITTAMREIYSRYKDGSELIISLESFLRELDLGKYAKAHRDENFMGKAIEKALGFIALDNKIAIEEKDTDPEDSTR